MLVWIRIIFVVVTDKVSRPSFNLMRSNNDALPWRHMGAISLRIISNSIVHVAQASNKKNFTQSITTLWHIEVVLLITIGIIDNNYRTLPEMLCTNLQYIYTHIHICICKDTCINSRRIHIHFLWQKWHWINEKYVIVGEPLLRQAAEQQTIKFRKWQSLTTLDAKVSCQEELYENQWTANARLCLTHLLTHWPLWDWNEFLVILVFDGWGILNCPETNVTDKSISGFHYGDVIMGAIASQIASLTIVYSTVYSDADQRKHQSSASLAFVRGVHREPVNSPHKWPVTRKMFPFDDVIMFGLCHMASRGHNDLTKRSCREKGICFGNRFNINIA